MKTFKQPKAWLALGIMAVALTGAVPAYADRDDRGRHDNDWHHHEVVAHRYWRHPDRHVVYAPPVYAPPPVVESPGINLILPLNFR